MSDMRKWLLLTEAAIVPANTKYTQLLHGLKEIAIQKLGKEHDIDDANIYNLCVDLCNQMYEKVGDRVDINFEKLCMDLETELTNYYHAEEPAQDHSHLEPSRQQHSWDPHPDVHPYHAGDFEEGIKEDEDGENWLPDDSVVDQLEKLYGQEYPELEQDFWHYTDLSQQDPYKHDPESLVDVLNNWAEQHHLDVQFHEVRPGAGPDSFEWLVTIGSAQEAEPNDSMDGDHASALASAGHGTDEDYGYQTYEEAVRTPDGYSEGDNYSNATHEQFLDWMKGVDRALVRKCGLSSQDLPDYIYRDMHDAGYNTEEAANEALANARDDGLGGDDMEEEVGNVMDTGGPAAVASTLGPSLIMKDDVQVPETQVLFDKDEGEAPSVDLDTVKNELGPREYANLEAVLHSVVSGKIRNGYHILLKQHPGLLDDAADIYAEHNAIPSGANATEYVYRDLLIQHQEQMSRAKKGKEVDAEPENEFEPADDEHKVIPAVAPEHTPHVPEPAGVKTVQDIEAEADVDDLIAKIDYAQEMGMSNDERHYDAAALSRMSPDKVREIYKRVVG